MATLDELVHYCNSVNPTGAFMLNGEWGTGKTHLIEHELAEKLKDTHMIVRVSLYGMNSMETMYTAVKEKWISACSPVLGKLVKEKEQVNKNSGLVSAISAILKGVSPAAGKAADLMVNLNVTDFLKIAPEVEDVHDHVRKKVVLVFDDLERSKLDPVQTMGLINEFCENQHFHTIIVTNEAYLIYTMGDHHLLYQMLKAKTVSRTIYYVPDFKAIISAIIQNQIWPSDAYKNYLESREEAILELFASREVEPEISHTGTVKTHNLLILTNGMEDFYRIFYHLNHNGVQDADPWFFSFLAYLITRRSGFFNDGMIHVHPEDEEIKSLYPQFDPAYLLPSERRWISYGIWDKKQFNQELADMLNR